MRTWLVVLIFLATSMVACGGSSDGGASSTPTPTGTRATTPGNNPNGTDRPTDDPTPTPTAKSTPSASPVPTPYVADWSSGLNGWTGDDEWTVVDGQLLSDTSGGGERLIAPFIPKDRDYAVEVKIQLVKLGCCGNADWGITARDGYYVGIHHNWFFEESSLFASADTAEPGLNTISELRHTPDYSPHTMRAEFDGNEIRLFIDGQLVLSGTSNAHLDPGRIGLFSRNVEVTVQSVRIELLS